MLTKKQLKILGIFLKNTFREYTFREIKELSKEKSNSRMQNAIKTFLKEDIITERVIGKFKLYSINHKNDKVYSYFDILIKENLNQRIKYTLNILEEGLLRHTFFYSLVIFGSYSINEQKSNSDLDIAVFIENEKDKKIIEAVLNSANNKSLITIDGFAITKNDFLEMLKIDEENLGKQIARKHLLIHNSPIFYSLLKEGIKNGFKL